MFSVRLLQSHNSTDAASVTGSDLETAPCPLCGASTMSIIHVFNPFKVGSCRECGLIYLNPRLKESLIGALYREGEYFSGGDAGYAAYSSQEESLRLTFRRFLHELRKRGMASGRLLEVGCGYGYFLDEAKSFFSYSAGTELSPEAVTYAKHHTGAEVFTGTVETLPRYLHDFDIIVLINVIEHVYDPIGFVMSLKQRLSASGTVVIATPDIGSFWYKLMKKRWPSFKIPEHVVFYNVRTLTSLFERTGFHTIEKIPFPHAFPLCLILSKIGINLRGTLCRRPVWLGDTMIAMAGKTA